VKQGFQFAHQIHFMLQSYCTNQMNKGSLRSIDTFDTKSTLFIYLLRRPHEYSKILIVVNISNQPQQVRFVKL